MYITFIVLTNYYQKQSSDVCISSKKHNKILILFLILLSGAHLDFFVGVPSAIQRYHH